jgi:hypothetical protein
MSILDQILETMNMEYYTFSGGGEDRQYIFFKHKSATEKFEVWIHCGNWGRTFEVTTIINTCAYGPVSFEDYTKAIWQVMLFCEVFEHGLNQSRKQEPKTEADVLRELQNYADLP